MRAKTYKCDDCGAEAEFTSYKLARTVGKWAVSKDYKNCYCPDCAPDHRKGGANNPKKKQPKATPEGQPAKGFVQVKIEI